MKKRRSFWLVIVFAVSFFILGKVNVQAEEHTLEEYRYTNPAYEGIEWSTDSYTDSYGIRTYAADEGEAEYTADRQQIVKEFREQMAARNSEIHLYYNSSELPTKGFFEQLFWDAVAPTGVGKEGDYIRWNCMGWGAGGAYAAGKNGTYNLHILYNMAYFTDTEQEAQVDEKVAEVLDGLQLSGLTEYQKIKSIYDYICSSVRYDYDNLTDDSYTLKFSAYAALVDKKAVCQGYASLFYRMAVDAGIDARVIAGDAGGSHAWNIVRLGKRYFNVDSTWDAGKTDTIYDYFLKNMDDFSDHKRDEEYSKADFLNAYPMAERSYTAEKVEGQYGNYQYEVNYAGEVVITKYTGTEEEVVIPSTIAGKTVAEIGNSAFCQTESMRTLTVPEGVESIASYAVCKCPNLEKIYLPKSLAKMEENIFDESPALTDVYYTGSQAEWDKIQKSHTFDGHNVTYHFNYYDCEKSGHIFKNGICTECNTVNGGKWLKSGSKWWYRYNDGYYPVNKLCKIGNTWYAFDVSGWMRTGWCSYSGKWYYMNGSGAMQTGWQKIGGKWYYMNGSGAMQTGWQKIGGKWYYMNGSGVMQTGWQKIGGKWYYLNGSGVMQTGWQKIGGKWYYLNGSGVMQTGWQKIGGKWYYMNGSGIMLTGKQKINGKSYQFNASGVWIK